MSSNQIALKVENLSKCYHIYNQPQDRLKQAVFPRLQLLTGRLPKNYFREFWALRDVSFEVKKGETIGIIGRNGSGKSTLLQLICGTLTPTSGTVTTNGRIAALLELGSGFNMEFTGRENVYLNGAILGLSQEDINARFDDIAAFADIGDFIEQPVKMYSSGMVVRLAFAVAINADPQILIVDEALSVGDELFQRKCFARIEEIRKNGATILFVSHSTSVIVQLCDRAILLEKGGQLLDGSPQQVTKQYHRLIFSNSLEREEILQSISRILPDGIDEEPRPVTKEDVDTGSNAIDEETRAVTKVEVDTGSFVSNMVPVSELKYSQNGGEIIGFEIQNLMGHKVNLVPPGFSGTLRVQVRFDESFQDVIFGFRIKSVSGLDLAGLTYPAAQEELIKVNAGDIVEIYWHVKFPFVPGIYFFTFGVRYLNDDAFINRVVDGLALKISERKNFPVQGLVDISNGNSGMKIIQKGYEYD